MGRQQIYIGLHHARFSVYENGYYINEYQQFSIAVYYILTEYTVVNKLFDLQRCNISRLVAYSKAPISQINTQNYQNLFYIWIGN